MTQPAVLHRDRLSPAGLQRHLQHIAAAADGGSARPGKRKAQLMPPAVSCPVTERTSALCSGRTAVSVKAESSTETTPFRWVQNSTGRVTLSQL